MASESAKLVCILAHCSPYRNLESLSPLSRKEGTVPTLLEETEAHRGMRFAQDHTARCQVPAAKQRPAPCFPALTHGEVLGKSLLLPEP